MVATDGWIPNTGARYACTRRGGGSRLPKSDGSCPSQPRAPEASQHRQEIRRFAMRCSRWQRWIALDVGGDLDHRRRLKLGRHLEQCASCRDLESELRQGRESLQGLDLRADANLSLGSIHGQVMQAIADRPRIAGFGIPRFALIAAAAAAVVILAVFLRQGPVERGPDRPTGWLESRRRSRASMWLRSRSPTSS